MTHSFLPRALLAASLTLVSLAATSPAAATNYHVASPGMACHAANAGATRFSYANHYLTNNNTTAQYVMCYLPLTDVTYEGQQLQYLGVDISTTAEGSGTVTCVAQTGAYLARTLMIRSSATRTGTLDGPSDVGSLSWSADVLVRSNSNNALTFNCKMDPGTRLGLISYGDA